MNDALNRLLANMAVCKLDLEDIEVPLPRSARQRKAA